METYFIKDLSFNYPLQDKLALSNINLKINSGEFVTICGRSGCGKTTLLRHLKPILAPHGKLKGEIFFQNQLISQLDQRTQASQIGFVFQNPDNQIVTDKVWHELAFGLESLGLDNRTIRLRVAEMASFFGIQGWFYKNVTELSGGQKQLLNLASILVMQPSVLILDEPTSQLDPIAAIDFIENLKKVNRELGITVIMTEHRLEEIIPICDRLIVLEDGVIIKDSTPEQICVEAKTTEENLIFAMTSAMRIYASVKNNFTCPITVKEGRQWLNKYLVNTKLETEQKSLDKTTSNIKNKEKIIELDEVWFKYDKQLPDVIKDLSLVVYKGDFFCVVGGNGTGKTTMLSIISGINQPYRGKVLIRGRNIEKISLQEKYLGGLGVLPQNPQALFVKKTVELDLKEMLTDFKISQEEKSRKLKYVIELAELEELLNLHPYDLSGGEQQRVALAKVLLLEPKILLLDEPTKGLDEFFKEKLAGIFKKLREDGVTIVMVSHDIEFCARYADTCAMFFDGSIVTVNNRKDFFAGNSFYTTAANRMVRHLVQDAITVEDVIEICQKSKAVG